MYLCIAIMGRYFIHLAYNGANYNGWQTQPGLPTVQQTLEKALTTLLRQPIAVVGCGRTDTGVHASDFYAHYDLNDPNDPKDLKDLVFKLNNLLPPDIVIYDIFPWPTTPMRASTLPPAPISIM